MRTLTAHWGGVIVVLAILNVLAWLAGIPQRHDFHVFSIGFFLGMLGTCMAAGIYGYRHPG